jgi:hypothetical protein
VKTHTLDFAQPFNPKGKERHEQENARASFLYHHSFEALVCVVAFAAGIRIA